MDAGEAEIAESVRRQQEGQRDETALQSDVYATATDIQDQQSQAKPPLPMSTRRSSSASHQQSKKRGRQLKQREKDFPDVNWDQALQQFAKCIYEELKRLNKVFVDKGDITFAAWKKLWLEERVSAAFHVEFWESTPSDTHRIILQQALDTLVECIESGSSFQEATAVAALLGYVFSLYCAYFVQLGSPKFKISVDPRSWAALLSIQGILEGTGARLFRRSSQEGLFMMKTLAKKENAFLQCLRGFGNEYRVCNTLSRQIGIESKALLVNIGNSADSCKISNFEINARQLGHIELLNDRYMELMKRLQTLSNVNSGSSRGRHFGILEQQRNALFEKNRKQLAPELTNLLRTYLARISSEPVLMKAPRDRLVGDSVNNVASSAGHSLNVDSAGFGGEDRDETESDDYLAELEKELRANISKSPQTNPSSENLMPKLSISRDHPVQCEREMTPSSELNDDESNELIELSRELDRHIAVGTSYGHEDDKARDTTQESNELVDLEPQFEADIASGTISNVVDIRSTPLQLTFAHKIGGVKSARTTQIVTRPNIRSETHEVPTLPERQRKLSDISSTTTDEDDLLAQLQAELDSSLSTTKTPLVADKATLVRGSKRQRKSPAPRAATVGKKSSARDKVVVKNSKNNFQRKESGTADSSLFRQSKLRRTNSTKSDKPSVPAAAQRTKSTHRKAKPAISSTFDVPKAPILSSEDPHTANSLLRLSLPSCASERSTSLATASGDESDGLDFLEAELQASTRF